MNHFEFAEHEQAAEGETAVGHDAGFVAEVVVVEVVIAEVGVEIYYATAVGLQRRQVDVVKRSAVHLHL